jgi:hypothetical protein
MRTTTATEPCGTCSAPVEVGPRTTRSRYGHKPLCDRCGTANPAYRYGGAGGSSAVRVMTDAELRRLGEWLDEHDPNGVVRAGMSPAQLRAAAARLGDGTEVDLVRCGRCGEFRPSEDMHEVASVSAKTGAAEGQLCDQCWHAVFGPGQPSNRSAYDEDDGDGAEVRYWLDGEPIFGEEPSGVPVEERSYSSRWWVPGSEGRNRDFVRVYDWQPA